MPRPTLLRQTNQVKTVATDAQVIDPDIQVLLVAEAQNLSDATQYAIDQFVMRGGRLMVMVDPWSEAMAAHPVPHRHAALRHRLESEEAVRRLGHPVRSRRGGRRSDRRVARARQSMDEVQAVNYVAWFNIRDGINHNDPATADLQQVTVASPGL